MDSELIVAVVSAGITMVGIVLAALQLRRMPRARIRAKDLGGHGGSGSLRVQRHLGESLVVGDIPREPLCYVRRERLLADAEAELRSGGVCVLVGRRGVGKTHLAAAYARARLRGGDGVVVWIVAENGANIASSLAELASRVGVVTEVSNTEVAAREALRWLERSAGSALIVLDNALDPDEVTAWLPGFGRAEVLITSTNQDFTVVGSAIQVGAFTEPQAVTFLCARTGRQDSAGARHVADELELLPLALAQAGWVIRRRGLSFADYLAGFSAAPLTSVLAKVPGERYPRSVAETTLASLADVEAEDATGLIRALVEFMAITASTGTRRELLHLVSNGSVEVDDAIGCIAGASLAGYDLVGGSVAMHRLIQRVALARVRDEARLGEVAEAASAALMQAIGRPGKLRYDVPIDLVDHITAVWINSQDSLKSAVGDDALTVRLLELRRWSVRRLTAAGELAKAVQLGGEVYADHKSSLPVDHELTVRARYALIQAYTAAQQMDAAIELAERGLADRLRLSGPHDESTIAARNTLGYYCEVGGQLERAIAIHSQNISEGICPLGPDHQTILYARINLASAYRSSGDLETAVKLFEENFAENVRIHGSEHRSTVNARGELARTYVRMGRSDEGILLHEQNAAIMRGWPAEEQELLWWPRYRAVAYSSAGRHDEAIGMLRELVVLAERQLPRDSLDTVRTRLFLARAVLAGGRQREAVALFKEVARDRQRILGDDHRSTLNARRNLGLALATSGRRRAALQVLRSAAESYHRVFGATHPYSRQAAADLAATEGARLTAAEAVRPYRRR